MAYLEKSQAVKRIENRYVNMALYQKLQTVVFKIVNVEFYFPFLDIEFRITTSLLIVTLFYIVCFTPYSVFYTVFQGTDMSQEKNYISTFIYIPYMLPYSTNFLIYVARNTKYRKAILFWLTESKIMIFGEKSEDLNEFFG